MRSRCQMRKNVLLLPADRFMRSVEEPSGLPWGLSCELRGCKFPTLNFGGCATVDPPVFLLAAGGEVSNVTFELGNIAFID
jgi:hypothetical protein